MPFQRLFTEIKVIASYSAIHSGIDVQFAIVSRKSEHKKNRQDGLSFPSEFLGFGIWYCLLLPADTSYRKRSGRIGRSSSRHLAKRSS